jgi:hypothetical protein
MLVGFWENLDYKLLIINANIIIFYDREYISIVNIYINNLLIIELTIN